MLPIIDKEFQALIPAIIAEERAQLEKNLLAEGIRDPLVVWQEILIDGHSRLAIARAHDLPFTVTEIDLPDRAAAKLWIIRNQLGRRNLSPMAIADLRGRLYNEQKKEAPNPDGANQYSEVGYQNDTKARTRDKLATEFGVSAPTIQRDGKFSESIDKLTDTLGPDARQTILSRDAKVTKQDVVALAKLEPKVITALAAQVLSGETPLNKAKRELVRRERQETPPMPETTDLYRIVYADPPWQYADKGLDDYGHAERHYPTMSITELCDLGPDLAGIVAPNAVLFLWATSPLLEAAFDIIHAWGFKYKTSFVWDKVGHNYGHYNSVRHEFLLICTKGSCTPDNVKLFDSVQSIQKSSTHSEKPEAFREIIDTLYTKGRRLELFARSETPNWDAWGNEPGIIRDTD